MHNSQFKNNSIFGNTGRCKTMFCDDAKPITPNDPNYVSQNQRLAGRANPKTLIPPVVVPPAADLDHWRANNLINHSHINTGSQWDTYLSGYDISSCCDIKEAVENYETGSFIGISDPQNPPATKCNPLPQVRHPIQSPQPTVSIPDETGFMERLVEVRKRNSSESYKGYDHNTIVRPRHLQHIQSPQPTTGIVKENFEYTKVRPNESGWMNTTCGYNPDQIIESNLPSNLAAGNCEKDVGMKRYNSNLFTQTIQPDVYTVNEVIEPINSNMGISFTQQFEPTTSYVTDGDVRTYTEHDPRVYQPNMVPYEINTSATEADVYDPRYSGYGTSYRAYNNDELGQTRFYYDDIDAVRMPNYISRSNIDFATYADKYGPLNESNKMGNKNTSNIREMAQASFLNSSLQQRDDLMERLMRKRNSEMWQLRKYPKYTTGGKRC